MELGDKIAFFDENKKQFTGTVSLIRDPKVNQDGKLIRKNLIDVKVRRMLGVLQTYENVPLKSDLDIGEKTFYYELQKPKTEKHKIEKTVKTKVKSILDKIQ